MNASEKPVYRWTTTVVVAVALTGTMSALAQQPQGGPTRDACLAFEADAVTPGTKVVVSGEKTDLVLDLSRRKVVELEEGEYRLHVTGMGGPLALSRDRVTLQAGTTVTVKIQRPGPTANRVLGGLRPGTVISVAISPDGKTIYIGEAPTGFGGPQAAQLIYVFDAATGQELQHFPSGGNVYDLAVLPNEEILVALEDGLVLMETRGGQVRRRFDGHVGRVKSVAITPDARRAVSCGAADGSVRVWSVETGEQLRAFTDPGVGLLMCVRVSDDGRTAIAGGADGVIYAYDLAAGAGPRRLGAHDDQVNSLAFLPHGRVVSAGRDRTIRGWDIASGRLLTKANAGTDVVAIATTPGGHRIVYGGVDSLVHVREVDALRDRAAMAGHHGYIWDIAMDPGGQFVVTSASDGTVRVWPLAAADVDPVANPAGNSGPVRKNAGRPGDGRRGRR